MEYFEFVKMAAVLKTAYPRSDIMPNKEAVTVWYDMLKDLDAESVKAAITAYIATKKFPPTIADIREMATPAKTDWGEAWGEVMQAVREYGYSRPMDALESMKPETRRIVERFGWQEICQAENIGVLRGQFKAAFEAAAKTDEVPVKRKELKYDAQGRIEGPVDW